MALQSGVSTSKVLILVGAGLTGSVVLKSAHLSEVILQLQELLKGVSQVDISPNKYDAALLAAQIRQLAEDIRELAVSNPITIFNGNESSGSYASYIVPAAAVGAMGYCYMWWKGLSFSDVMYVTKHNMKNAVATVSKQLDNVTEALNSTKKHLTKRLENLDWKMEEQMETSKLIAKNVYEVDLNLSRIGADVELIQQMVLGLEGKMELIENKQNMTNSGLWYLCQKAGNHTGGINAKPFQEVSAKLVDHSSLNEEKAVKGLKFIVDNNEPIAINKPILNSKKFELDNGVAKTIVTKTRIHRSYTVGLSLTSAMS